jgi:CDP-diacylglycerol--glycerol-3-phosphate 3-phosphatidyltransferase
VGVAKNTRSAACDPLGRSRYPACDRKFLDSFSGLISPYFGLAHWLEIANLTVVNLPNLLTLSRIPIIFGVVALLYMPITGASTAAFVLFVLGAITDWADGYYARKQGLVSNFGKLMDALTDKVFMVGLFITLVVMQKLPGEGMPQLLFLFFLLLILSREFLITGLRLVAASSGIILAAEKSGKHKTVSQMVSAILLLLAIAIRNDFPNLFPEIFGDILHWSGVGFFVLATVLTVSSGTMYMIKYWSVFTGEEEKPSE